MFSIAGYTWVVDEIALKRYPGTVPQGAQELYHGPSEKPQPMTTTRNSPHGYTLFWVKMALGPRALTERQDQG